MLASERRRNIERCIQENGSATVIALAKMFQVSDQTIRRDLKQLEEKGTIVVTFGGAYVREIDTPKYDIDVQKQRAMAKEEKKRIAKAASVLMDEGDCFFVDQSTTALAAVEQYLSQSPHKDYGTLVTNSLLMADLLKRESITTILLGGEIDRKNACTFGDVAIDMVERYYFDKMFFTVSSISMETGMTDVDLRTSELRRKALFHAKKKILLVDHTKFDNTSAFQIGMTDEVDVIITDTPLSAEWITYCDTHDIELIIAEAE